MFHMNRLRPLNLGLFLWVLLAGMTGLAQEASPTFAQWQAACAKLPLNRSLGGSMPPQELLPLPTFDGLNRVLDAFFELATNGPLAKSDQWVGPAPQTDTFFNLSRSGSTPPEAPFEPFVQKLILPPGSSVFLQGDLHGDIHSLLAVLGRLQERRWLDGFTLLDPTLHVIFLGDYTDRGRYGIEVIYTLLRLKLANPDRVHFVRGNHEDVTLVARYGFLAEGTAKYGPNFKAAKVMQAYDFLPVAIYLGSGSNLVQLCHGGMEPGFNPAPLLAAPGTNRFQGLGSLRQATFLKENPEWLANDPQAAVTAQRQLTDFTPAAPTSPSVIGFMWNDFTVFQGEPAFAHNPDRAFVYGQPAVKYLLEKTAASGATVHAVIRGHQHSSVPNPLMRRLVASQGIFRHWQETNSAAARTANPAELTARLEAGVCRALPENSVWTLNVSPDSVYGAGCNFDFATFGVLRLAERFGDWRITVETVKVPRW